MTDRDVELRRQGREIAERVAKSAEGRADESLLAFGTLCAAEALSRAGSAADPRPVPISTAELETWSRVEAAISAEAEALCKTGCDADCGACGARHDREWRRTALASLRSRGRDAEVDGRRPAPVPGVYGASQGERR